MGEIRILVRREERKGLSQLYEDTCIKKVTVYKPGSKPSPDTRSTGTLILYFSTFKTGRNIYLNYPVCTKIVIPNA